MRLRERGVTPGTRLALLLMRAAGAAAAFMFLLVLDRLAIVASVDGAFMRRVQAIDVNCA